MADALVTPTVGGAMWAATAGVMVYSSAKLRTGMDDRKVPLMGVLGAFIFAAQMITFTIPPTGSSGHLGGGMILAILLGPYGAFLTMASVLTIQALFFADGGLLALGCNIFNLGVFPAFIAYPFIYKKIVGSQPSHRKIIIGAVASCIVGLQLGALGVVVETVFSGISALPFTTFVTLMQSIHLVIGIIEGLVTASVISFISAARPEIVDVPPVPDANEPAAVRTMVIAFLAAAVILGGVISRFASVNPDGLEWSLARVTGTGSVASNNSSVHGRMASLQEKSVLFPDYSFRKPEDGKKPAPSAAAIRDDAGKQCEESNAGTSVAGLLGGLLSLGLAAAIGLILKKHAGTASKQ